MTEKRENCSGEHHEYPLAYICYEDGCRNRFLCEFCYQTHFPGCKGRYGKSVRKYLPPQEDSSAVSSADISDTPMDDTFEAIQSSRSNAKALPTVTQEEVIQKYDTMKNETDQSISELFDLGKTIREQNLESLKEIKSDLGKLLEERQKKWDVEQEERLIKMNEFSQQNLSDLKEFQSQLKAMKFSKANFVSNHSKISELETKIVPKAKEKIQIMRQTMNGWTLNQERIKEYQDVVSKIIQAVEFTALLNSEKLELKPESLPQACDQLQRMSQEIQILRAGDLELKDLIKKLRQENETLKQEKNDAVAQEKAKTEAKITALAQEKANAEIKITALTQEKENSEAKINALTQEKANIETKVTTLTRKKKKAEVHISVLTQAKTNAETKVAALNQEKTNVEAKVAALNQAKNDAEAKIPPLTQAKNDAEAKITALTQAKNDAEAKITTLTQAKNDAEVKVAALTQEKTKAELDISVLTQAKTNAETKVTALTQEKTKVEAQITALTQERDVLKAKVSS